MSTVQTVYQIPGPKGDAGSDGSDGADGSNAFTTTTAQFTMPAEGATVVVPVTDSSWASIGQIVHVDTAGHLKVSAKPSATQITLTNEENTASGLYPDNAAPATVIATGKRVAPAGLQGPAGADGSSGADASGYYLVDRAANAPANAQNLGLLTTGLLKVTVAGAAATLSTASAGTDYVAPDAELTALAGLASAADKVPYFTGAGTADVADLTAFGRTLIANANAGDARSDLGAAAAGANSDITSLAGLSTALSKAQGGTGVTKAPAFSANRGGTDQSGVATETPTKIAFNTEVFDTDAYFDTSAQRFTPLIAGHYAFTIAAQVNALAATGDIVQVHLYKNGAVIATAKAITPDAADNVQALLTFIASANGSTDYFEAFVEHDAGVDKTVEGDEEVTFFCGHWIR